MTDFDCFTFSDSAAPLPQPSPQPFLRLLPVIRSIKSLDKATVAPDFSTVYIDMFFRATLGEHTSNCWVFIIISSNETACFMHQRAKDIFSASARLSCGSPNYGDLQRVCPVSPGSSAPSRHLSKRLSLFCWNGTVKYQSTDATLQESNRFDVFNSYAAWNNMCMSQ